MADGYLSNATVCLDVNENNTCDADEPTTTSDSNGNYEIEADTEEEANSPILAVAKAGETLDGGEAISEDYSIGSPAGSDSFVSPITALVQTVMQANPQMAKSEARNYIASFVGKSGNADQIFEDYIESNDGALHKVSQGVRKAFQKVRGQVKTEWGDNYNEGEDLGNLRYATRRLVRGQAGDIRSQLQNGTSVSNLDVAANTSDIKTLEEYKSQLAAKAEANIVSAQDYMESNPE